MALVRRRDEAREQLEDIWLYIARANAAAADRLLDRIGARTLRGAPKEARTSEFVNLLDRRGDSVLVSNFDSCGGRKRTDPESRRRLPDSNIAVFAYSHMARRKIHKLSG